MSVESQTTHVLAFVNKRLEIAKPILLTYPPVSVNWHDRAQTTINRLVPALVAIAPGLKFELEAAINVHSYFGLLREHVIPGTARNEFDTQQVRLAALLAYMRGSGDGLSWLITRYITAHPLFSTPAYMLAANGACSPDLYLVNNDYSMLPRHERRRNTDTDEALTKRRARHGAELMNEHPAWVTDGLEIKTTRRPCGMINRTSNHPGLYLCLRYQIDPFEVTDLRVGYISAGLCRRYIITNRGNPPSTAAAVSAVDMMTSLLREETPYAGGPHKRGRPRIAACAIDPAEYLA